MWMFRNRFNSGIQIWCRQWYGIKRLSSQLEAAPFLFDPAEDRKHSTVSVIIQAVWSRKMVILTYCSIVMMGSFLRRLFGLSGLEQHLFRWNLFRLQSSRSGNSAFQGWTALLGLDSFAGCQTEVMNRGNLVLAALADAYDFPNVIFEKLATLPPFSFETLATKFSFVYNLFLGERTICFENSRDLCTSTFIAGKKLLTSQTGKSGLQSISQRRSYYFTVQKTMDD